MSGGMIGMLDYDSNWDPSLHVKVVGMCKFNDLFFIGLKQLWIKSNFSQTKVDRPTKK